MPPSDPATITIELPADVRFFRSVRLAVGGLATMVGFDVEAIDDLRIGVDELCATLVEQSNGAPVKIVVHTQEGELIRIEGSTERGDEDTDDARFSFSRQILSVVADSFGFEVDGERFRCWLERATSDERLPGQA